ncbi:MAG: carbohydrate ABC transporter permease [Ruminiclostridium sp.]|nr:carbohydrate ABC transporter permease [Ruminiclostridium sp.]
MMKRLTAGRVFDIANTIVMLACIIFAVYPLLYVILGSISESTLLIKNRGITLKPLGFSLDAYKLVFNNDRVITGYKNTLIYMTVGTAINVTLTAFGAYALSRRNVLFKNAIMMLIVFTMFFDGGLVPLYLVIKNLHLYNSMWAIILPSAMSVWYLIIMRTGFQSVPESMEESARIDGANDFTILFRIIIPLAMPVIAVIILFYGVYQWNSYFYAMVFLLDLKLYPLQLVLRDLLITQNADKMMIGIVDEKKLGISISIRYAAIVVATVPVLLVYPFLQKYFVKGIMIGAIKS